MPIKQSSSKYTYVYRFTSYKYNNDKSYTYINNYDITYISALFKIAMQA